MSQAAGKPVGPLFQIDNEVTRCIRKHARSHMKTEVCGVLIGETRDGVVEVCASIEALNAAQAGTHVTFTQDAWETIYKVKDESYPNQRIVGWYHSHPGFGVFLSEHDAFIHRNFFSSPDQVAWVYDPHTDEEGCFGWVDGAIHRISNLSIIDNNGDGVERTPKEIEFTPEEDEESRAIDRIGQGRTSRVKRQPAWLRWMTTILGYSSALILGFALAYFVFPRVVVLMFDPSSGALLELSPQLAHRLLELQP
ncbi:MAG: Mov34/MPN/PAD-1 family protein, partial [Terriglobales bacterium]